MTTGQADPWTVLRLLEWTTDYFRKRGSTTARLDAEVLLAEARGCSRIELYTAFDSEPSDEVREAFREMVRRRGEGTPVAYLVGHKEFYSIDLRVNEATLIPRPETEHVVIEALDRAKQIHSQDAARRLEIADVGTGSGAIACAIAANLPECRITATDTSPAALEVARYNCDKLGLTERVRLREGALLEPVESELQFDLICSNPPYVSEDEYDALPSTVKDFEPRAALVAGPSGLEVLTELLAIAGQRLREGGWLICELSPMIAEAAEQAVRDHGELSPAHFVKDLAGHRRVLVTQRTSPA